MVFVWLGLNTMLPYQRPHSEWVIFQLECHSLHHHEYPKPLPYGCDSPIFLSPCLSTAVHFQKLPLLRLYLSCFSLQVTIFYRKIKKEKLLLYHFFNFAYNLFRQCIGLLLGRCFGINTNDRLGIRFSQMHPTVG